MITISNESTVPDARILLADDSPINQAVTRSMLKHLGFTQVDVVEHGGAALDRLADHAYGLVLMDCQMPIMDGYAASRAIRELEESETRTRVPIIALSGKVMDEDLEACREHGMDDCLNKPFQLSQLRQCLERWLSAEV